MVLSRDWQILSYLQMGDEQRGRGVKVCYEEGEEQRQIFLDLTGSHCMEEAHASPPTPTRHSWRMLRDQTWEHGRTKA